MLEIVGTYRRYRVHIVQMCIVHPVATYSISRSWIMCSTSCIQEIVIMFKLVFYVLWHHSAST